VYELVAVLHHKGGSASHGHYTAEIKDTDANKYAPLTSLHHLRIQGATYPSFDAPRRLRDVCLTFCVWVDRWWFFDDTEVKPVKSGGAPEDAAANGEDSAAGTSTSTAAAPSNSGNGGRRGRAPKSQSEEVVVVDSDIEEVSAEPANGAATNG
jgi:hypothetical protein